MPILYEDEEIFVIDKPSGLAVQGGSGVSRSLDAEFSNQVGEKVYLVHRLDKDTRGLMIVAKSAGAAGKWTRLISSKAVRKEYAAVCAGQMSQKKGVISDVVVQHGEKKSATTHFLVEKQWSVRYENENTGETLEIPLTLLRLTLETGRMHQIRIHLAKNGCPIVGDDQHGNFKINKMLKKAAGYKTLQLAAVKLTVPVNGKNISFEIQNPLCAGE